MDGKSNGLVEEILLGASDDNGQTRTQWLRCQTQEEPGEER